jgi:geranylgeranyl reductase family protein
MGSDALVVGAGPAGLLAAKEIASRGYSVSVLEEHAKVGVPSHCAGMISVEGLSRIGVEASGDFVQNTIVGGRIYAPDGEFIEIKDKRPRAHIVDRAALDGHIAGMALDAGANIAFSKRAEELILVDGRFAGVAGAGWIEKVRVIIDAEGPSRRLAKGARLVKNRRKTLLGVNTEIDCEVEADMVEVWFGRETAPGFFAWVIPLSGKEARVGLATSEGDPMELLATFVKKRFDAPCPPPRAGQVLVDGPIDRTAFPGLLLVGDAAGQVKPTTGGGVVMGGLCAIEAGKTAVKALESEDITQLDGYEDAWRALYGSEFRSMQILRNLADRVSDERMNRFMRAFGDAKLGVRMNELVAEGDMDLQGEVIKRALSEPRLMKAALSGLGRLALAELRGLVNL